MMHEGRADTLPLVLVDHSESHLGRFTLHDDVTPTARDHGPAAFFHDRSQRDGFDEVDIQEKIDFRLREAASYRKETTVSDCPLLRLTAAMRSARSSGEGGG